MNIKVIVGSVRAGRIGVSIAKWVERNITAIAPTETVEVIDLADWHLPMDDEPHMPHTGKYIQPHTIKWSEKISEGDAYVFVFPEYNAGYPASLKNAVDHLKAEWRGKPAILLSYAYRGGVRAADAFRQVLGNIRMQIISTPVEVKLGELTFAEDGSIKDLDESFAKYAPVLAEALKLAQAAPTPAAYLAA